MSLAPVRALRLAGAALIVSGGLIVASCGGGTSNYTPIPQPTASSAPATQSIPTTGGTLTLPTAGTQVPSIALAAGAPAGVSITAQSSTTPPANAPAITSVKRVVQSGITGAIPFFYVEFTVSAALSSQYLASESINLTSSDPTTAQYGAAFDDITSTPGTELGAAGPGTISNGIVTITNTNTSGTVPTFQTGHTYLIQFFYVPASASPSASPSSSASASPSPSSSASASPSSSPSPAPSSSASASPSSSPSAAPSPSPTATAVTLPTFTLSTSNDGCVATLSGSCSNPPLQLQVGNVIMTAAFGTPQSTGATPNNLSIEGAVSPSAISPESSFPFYTPQSGTVQLYFIVSAQASLVYAQTPTIIVNGVSGTSSCTFYGYTNNSGTGTTWGPLVGPATISGGMATFSPTTLTGTVDINTSQFIGAIVCQ